MNNWQEYRNEACPICGHKHWCGHSEDGNVIHCMRMPSKNPCASGGWFHFLVDHPKRVFVRHAPRRPVRQLFDADATMKCFRAEFENYRGGDIFDSLCAIADDLNLCAADIDRLLVGRSSYYQSWCFPMLDANGRTIGIRLRRYGSSDKFSVSGSRDGLFYDPELQPMESVVNGINGRELVVVEGATDCIAGYALGLPCVGRSSCTTGGDLLSDLISRLKVSRVTIVTDNDAYHARSDGSLWRPGIDGAIRLAKRLKRCYRIVTPPKKDLRDWVSSGLDKISFLKVAALQPWKVA